MFYFYDTNGYVRAEVTAKKLDLSKMGGYELLGQVDSLEEAFALVKKLNLSGSGTMTALEGIYNAWRLQNGKG